MRRTAFHFLMVIFALNSEVRAEPRLGATISCFTANVEGKVLSELDIHTRTLSPINRPVRESLPPTMSYEAYPVADFQTLILGKHMYRLGVQLVTKPFSQDVPIAAFSIHQEFDEGLQLKAYKARELSKFSSLTDRIRLQVFDADSKTNLFCYGSQLLDVSKLKRGKRDRIPAKQELSPAGPDE